MIGYIKMDVQNCIARITNGQETAKVLAHFCYNNSIEAAGNA